MRDDTDWKQLYEDATRRFLEQRAELTALRRTVEAKRKALNIAQEALRFYAEEMHGAIAETALTDIATAGEQKDKTT